MARAVQGFRSPGLAPSVQTLPTHSCSAAHPVPISTHVLSDQGILHGPSHRPIKTVGAPFTTAEEPPRSELPTPADYQDQPSFSTVVELTATMAVLVAFGTPILAASG
jgi:hypothetical protein